MANDFTGRTWKINTNGQTPFGTANVKIKGGLWTGMTAGGQVLTITDVDGRVYSWTSYNLDYPLTIPEMGWLSGPLTFSIPSGELDLYLGTR